MDLTGLSLGGKWILAKREIAIRRKSWGIWEGGG